MSSFSPLIIIIIILSFNKLSQSTYNDKPNFIYIFADDLGFNDVAWRQASNIYTPNLDALRNNHGVELTRFYVTPKCSPTRASFMTGRYSYKIGMQHSVGIAQQFTCSIEPSPETTFFTEKLKECAGYNNYYMGKWHLGEYSWSSTPIFRGGFDYYKGYLNSEVDYFNFTYDTDLVPIYDWREGQSVLRLEDTDDNYTTTAFGEKALEILNEIGDTNDETPFTLILSFESPHGPIHFAPERYSDIILTDAGINGPGGPYGNPSNDNYEDRRMYVSMVYAMDYYIGEIFDALRYNEVNNISIWDNTYLFFFSDNGGVISYASNYPLRGAKSTNFEGGIRVPAFISGGLLPSRLKGKTYDGLAHITDLYPTALDYAGVSTDGLSLDGISLRTLLESFPGASQGGLQHDRDRFVITTDPVGCAAQFDNITVCGGIIRDFNMDNDPLTSGIWKLVIGSEALTGTQKKFGWGELDNQDKVIEYWEDQGETPQIICDPNGKNYSKPEYDDDFKANDCGPNNLPCLYKLDDDPCEIDNKAENMTYRGYLIALMDELQEAYDNQEDPFWTRDECNEADAMDVYEFMNRTGYWTPFEKWWVSRNGGNGNAFSRENTEIYRPECANTTTTVMPTTNTPSSSVPTTLRPTTDNPTTDEPITAQPTTLVPTTSNPTTSAPTPSTPITSNPTTDKPTTNEPTTSIPTTAYPTTFEPTTSVPTTNKPTTSNPTTVAPTTVPPTTIEPTTLMPSTNVPSSSVPTTDNPTTDAPITAEPTTLEPTTLNPTTSVPTTSVPTTSKPSTYNPTTNEPTTFSPTTGYPTTYGPTTSVPTTSNPTSDKPTTSVPTTNEPTTSNPTTFTPTTFEPTSFAPTTVGPTTAAPTTVTPTTVEPTTVEPTTIEPTTVTPTTVRPTTSGPTTIQPTTVEPSSFAPSTIMPTTMEPTTFEPTTVEPTTIAPTTTLMPTTNIPTTTEPTTMDPTIRPTTVTPTTIQPTTMEPTTMEPTTMAPTTVEPTTMDPTTMDPTTMEPTTMEPTTMRPTNVDPTTMEPTTIKPTTMEPSTMEPTTMKPTTTQPITMDPTTMAPTTMEPTTMRPTTFDPTMDDSIDPTMEPTLEPTTEIIREIKVFNSSAESEDSSDAFCYEILYAIFNIIFMLVWMN